MNKRARFLYAQLAQAIEKNGGVGCEQAPDAFFLDESDPNGPYKTRVAKAICGQCPVRALCLEYSIVAREEHGIWGGLSRPERLAIVRKGRAVA